MVGIAFAALLLVAEGGPLREEGTTLPVDSVIRASAVRHEASMSGAWHRIAATVGCKYLEPWADVKLIQHEKFCLIVRANVPDSSSSNVVVFSISSVRREAGDRAVVELVVMAGVVPTEPVTYVLMRRGEAWTVESRIVSGGPLI